MSTSPVGSPRISWAPIIAKIVGEGAPPPVTAQDIHRVLLTPFMQELTEKDEKYLESLTEQLEERRQLLLNRVNRVQDDALLILATRLHVKKHEVMKYRETQLKFREAELAEERTAEKKAELERLRELNKKYLGRLSHDMSPSDIADIAFHLDQDAKDSIDTTPTLGDEGICEETSDIDIVIQKRRERLCDIHMKYFQKLVADLDAEEEALTTLVAHFNLKFRSQLAVKLTGEIEMTDAERDKLVKLRDQERERLVAQPRAKASYEAHLEENRKFIEETDKMCVKCFGIVGSLPAYYQYLGIEIDSCVIMGCGEMISANFAE